MEEQYGFKAKKCQCGQNLTGVKVEVDGFWRGNISMGSCPKCGRGLPLDAPPVEPVIPASAAPAKKSTSKK